MHSVGLVIFLHHVIIVTHGHTKYDRSNIRKQRKPFGSVKYIVPNVQVKNMCVCVEECERGCKSRLGYLSPLWPPTSTILKYAPSCQNVLIYVCVNCQFFIEELMDVMYTSQVRTQKVRKVGSTFQIQQWYAAAQTECPSYQERIPPMICGPNASNN